MLEFMLVGKFATTNADYAERRGHSTSLARVLTYLLYYFGLLGGLALGLWCMVAADELIFMVLAGPVAGAALGLLISRLFAKRGAEVYDPPSYAYLESTGFAAVQPMRAPCEITLVRENAYSGCLVPAAFLLNGQPIGSLKNGEQMVFATAVFQNRLSIDGLGMGSRPYDFTAVEGGRMVIHYKGNRFLPQKTVVTPGLIQQLDGYGTPVPPPYAPQQYPQQPSGQVPPPQHFGVDNR